MKNFSIGDGDKQVTCPDRYVHDDESGGTVVIWDPDHIDIPIRVSVITIRSKDEKEYEAARWYVIEKAQEKSAQLRNVGNKAIYSYRQPAREEGFAMHYFEVGMGNHHFLFSITVSSEDEGSEAFSTINADLEKMIESLVERKKDQQFDCILQESEKEAIRDACGKLIDHLQGEAGWRALQSHYDAAVIGEPPKDSGKIGYVFGELLRQEVPSFHWKVKIDEYGRSRSLDFGEAKISIFPESMIWKRLDRKEEVDLHQLSSDTIEAVENMYRRFQDEAAESLKNKRSS